MILDRFRHLESAVTSSSDLEGLAPRYGAFYGPGTGLGEGGSVLEAIRRRRFPIVGSGGGVWSFVHLDDMTSATVAAVEGEAAGIYNVTGDDPTPVREWLPALRLRGTYPRGWRV